jgi:hypothetical protein
MVGVWSKDRVVSIGPSLPGEKQMAKLHNYANHNNGDSNESKALNEMQDFSASPPINVTQLGKITVRRGRAYQSAPRNGS